MNNLKELLRDAKGLSVLCVEDNEVLRHKAVKLLKKFFSWVDEAEDGLAGLELFKKHHYSILITDIRMPNMDGMTLIKNVKKINPNIKTIIMSAHDDKELLFDAIEQGVFRFLKKPVDVTKLTTVLHQATLEIRHESNRKIFYSNLENIFNYQDSMVVMLHENSIVLANDVFLEFFGYKSNKECQSVGFEISGKFLEEDGCLHNANAINALDVIRENEHKFFHIKLKNKNAKTIHFIIKYQAIPKKMDYGILSFEDISDLNILDVADVKENNENVETSSEDIHELLETIQRKNIPVKLHNFYKGLKVTNNAMIMDWQGESLTLKTSYLQIKAIQMQQSTLLISNELPFSLLCSKIEGMSFEKQEVQFKGFKFMKSSPINRKSIRVTPTGKQEIKLFLEDEMFHGDVEIEDISLEAVRLKLNAFPAGLDEKTEVEIEMFLEFDNKKTIMKVKGKVLRKYESKHHFHIVFMFVESQKNILVEYITYCQMALIREIKGMQNG